MEERAGARGTISDGVFFTESAPASARVLGPASVEISRQNATLTDVKHALALRAVKAGGNAIVGFRYGQRAHSWWELLLLKWDTESWYGRGSIAILND
ncbi:MAG: hypothetical protein ACYC0B_02190 [Gemmatimonadaceae bacterium]